VNQFLPSAQLQKEEKARDEQGIDEYLKIVDEVLVEVQAKRDQSKPNDGQPRISVDLGYRSVLKDPEAILIWRKKLNEARRHDRGRQQAVHEVCKHDLLFWINAFLFTDDRCKPPVHPDLLFIVSVIVPALIRAAGQPFTGLIDDDLDLDLVTWKLRDLGTYRGARARRRPANARRDATRAAKS